MDLDINEICLGCMEKKDKVICGKCGFTAKDEKYSSLTLVPGTIIGNGYLIGKVLGKGGFGITYIGYDIRLSKKVAVKEYLPNDHAGRADDKLTVAPHSEKDREVFLYGLEKFLEEARTLAKFEHYNIARINGCLEENRTAYLIMDYYEGETLSEFLKKRGKKLSEKSAVQLMLPIMDGLRQVHKAGMLHRDIKPQNIYLTKDKRPILLDFGAARMAAGEKTQSLSMVLTPGFAPFEQYSSRGKQGPWSDVYSVAATIYYMVTGEQPAEATDRILDDILISPKLMDKRINKKFSDIIVRALSVKTEKRPPSIEEFQRVLIECGVLEFKERKEAPPERCSRCGALVEENADKCIVCSKKVNKVRRMIRRIRYEI